MFKNLLILFIAILVSNCQSAKDYKNRELSLPTSWDKSVAKQQIQGAEQNEWWTRFNDPVLDSLIKQALTSNSDILIAISNINKARAELSLSQATSLPEINLQATAERTRNSTNTKSAGDKKITNSFNLAAVLNYELDLWGAVANANKAAKAQLLSAESSKAATRLTIASNVATAYFGILASDSQLTLTKQLIAVQQEIYDLNKDLYKLGASDLISLNQAALTLTSTQATLPPLKQQLQEQEHALGILLGKSPNDLLNESIPRGQTLESLIVLPIVPKILPSELLQQRPDIRAAEQNLIAASSEIAVARAAYFPTISLTGLLGLDSTKFKTLFNNYAKTWQIGSSITGPIFNFGRTQANVKIAEANRQQYLLQYQNTIRVAFQEVYDALSAQKNLADIYDIWQKNENAQLSIMERTKQRYKHGNIAYLTLLSAKQNLLQAKINLVGIKLQRLNAIVNLFQALGGDWNSPPASLRGAR